MNQTNPKANTDNTQFKSALKSEIFNFSNNEISKNCTRNSNEKSSENR